MDDLDIATAIVLIAVVGLAIVSTLCRLAL